MRVLPLLTKPEAFPKLFLLTLVMCLNFGKVLLEKVLELGDCPVFLLILAYCGERVETFGPGMTVSFPSKRLDLNKVGWLLGVVPLILNRFYVFLLFL